MGKVDLLGIHMIQILFSNSSLFRKSVLPRGRLHAAHLLSHCVKSLSAFLLISRATGHCDFAFYVAVDNLFSCLHSEKRCECKEKLTSVTAFSKITLKG